MNKTDIAAVIGLVVTLASFWAGAYFLSTVAFDQWYFFPGILTIVIFLLGGLASIMAWLDEY